MNGTILFSIYNTIFCLLAVCALGTLSPANVQCGPINHLAPVAAAVAGNVQAITATNGGGGNVERSARRHRDEYLSEIEYINPNANISTLLSSVHRLSAIFSLENHVNEHTSGTRGKHAFGRGKDCNVPKKVDDAMVYK